MYFQFLIEDQSSGALIDILMQKIAAPHKNVLSNNSDYLQKARKYGHFTGYKN